MPETLALFRLSLAHSRRLLAVMVATVACGVAIALYAGSLEAEESIAGAALAFTLLPAALATLILFDYGHECDLGLPGSGCSQWVMRMPIDAWKIAIVPMVLKTLWVAVLWLTMLVTVRYLGEFHDVPLVQPILSFSSIAIWLLVIAWRPYRSGWGRLGWLALALPILYCSAVAVFAAPEINQLAWRPTAVVGAYASAALIYAAGVVVGVRTVRLARVSVTGIIPEKGKEQAADEIEVAGASSRTFRNAHHALIHHDIIRLAPWVRKIFLVAILPSMVALLFLPFSLVTLILVLVIFADLAAVAMSLSSTSAASTPGMPPYLAASPLSTASLAWVRGVVPLAVCAFVLSLMCVVFLGWAAWPSNREVWYGWATDCAEQLGAGADPMMIGLRWTLTILLASVVAFLGAAASLGWIGSAGRQWFTVTITVLMSIAFLVPVGFFLRWFMRQTDWEATQSAIWNSLTLVPAIAVTLLVIKLLSTIAVGVGLLRRQLITSKGLGLAIGTWATLVAVLSIAFASLVPDPRFTLVMSFAVVTLVIPLARVLLMPIMLSWNRHR